MPRPLFRPSAEQRRIAGAMLAAGCSLRSVARRLEIARGTVARHFAPAPIGIEAEIERARRRLAILKALEKQSEGGSTTATKRLVKMTDR